MLSTWPLARDMGHSVALGLYRNAAVTLTTEWTLAWTADRLGHGLRHYWDAPLFAPELGTFALSEPQPLNGLFFTLPYALTGSLEVSYALVLLLTLTLNGWAALRLLRRGGMGLGAATVGSAMVTLLPFVHAELGVLPFITLAGALSALEAWLWFLEGPSARRAAALGAAVGASYFLSCQLTLLFVVVLTFAAPFTLPCDHWSRRTLASLAVGALVCGVLVAPVAAKQLEVSRLHHLQRSAEVVRSSSAGLDHYARPPFAELPFIPGFSPPGNRRAHYPGTLKLALAAACVYFAVRRRRMPRIERLGAALTVSAVIIGVGPLLHVGPVSVYRALAFAVPGFRQIRGLFHAAAFAQLGVVLLATAAIDTLRKEPLPRFGRPEHARRWAVLWFVAGSIAAIELWPRGQHFATPPSFARNAGWIDWVRTHTAEDATLAFVPFPASTRLEAFEPTTNWMRFGTRFARKMVNGYSSYFPASTRQLSNQMKHFPEESSLAALRAAGVTTVLVDRQHYVGARPPLRLAFADELARIDVFELSQK